MNARAAAATFGEFARNGLGVPLLVMVVLAMMVLPLPAFLLDIFFTFNITLSIMILLAVIYVRRALEFATFPTVLLGATLLRLGLNVASTRIVLINGHTGSHAAGRISEVSARFTLDAMPGRQMAIDADLNAGIITQAEAIVRRQEVREEADFYGAMDGASKFVRGDAIAGILIVFINLFGGTIIGAAQHGMSLADAGRTYALLTIGDGLVAQIPALLLSVAVAILVTRVSRPHDMSQQIMTQVLGQPKASDAVAAAAPAAAAAVPSEQRELSWDDVEPVDLIGLEVGYRLIPLVDRNQGGELMGRIKGVRKKLSEELGFLVQPVHIRDNLELGPSSYRITILGAPVGESEVFPDRELAINPGQVSGTLPGSPTKDPAFGLEAIWIEKSRREQAQAQGYTVVDASSVIATHLSHLLQSHAHELLGHEEVQQLLNRLGKSAPKLIEDLVPKLLPMSVVVKVLQYLLLERVPIRNLRTICETLAELAPRTQDPLALVAAVRIALGRSIVQNIGGLRQELPVITLDPALEQVLQDSMAGGGDGSPGFEPGLADRVQTALADSTRRQEAAGEPAVLLVAPKIRPWIAKLMRHSTPSLAVLAYNEIPENRRIRVIAAVGR